MQGASMFFTVTFFLAISRYLKTDTYMLPLDSLRTPLYSYSFHSRMEKGDYLPSVIPVSSSWFQSNSRWLVWCVRLQMFGESKWDKSDFWSKRVLFMLTSFAFLGWFSSCICLGLSWNGRFHWKQAAFHFRRALQHIVRWDQYNLGSELF